MSRTGIEPGSPVVVVYKDHVRFENSDASQFKPWTLELIGWLDHEDEGCICVVSERYAEPRASGNSRVRSTGVTIVKSTIVMLKRLAGNGGSE